MPRRLPLALLLLAPAFVAAAPPPDLAAVAAARPDRRLDPVVDGGAVPGGNARANRLAVQSCLVAAASTPGGSVLLRADLQCDRPVYLPNGARLDGDGIGRLSFPGSCGLTTLAPAPLGHGVAPTDLPDSTPLLDSTAANHIGVRLDGRATVAELGGPFSQLARRDLTALTLEFAFADIDLAGPHGLAVGWSERGAGRPAYVATDSSGEVVIGLGLADGRGPTWRVPAPALRTPGTHRVALQVDVVLGRMTLRVDGQGLTIPGLGLDPNPDARLASARRTPFKAGGLSASPANCYSDTVTIAPQGAVLLGVVATPAARYAWDGPAPATSDLATYFRPPAGGACLRLDDVRDDVIATRSLLIGGDARGAAMLLAPEHANVWASPSRIRLSGLTVDAGNDALAWGLGIASRIEDCTFTSQSGSAIGGWRCGANYANHAERLKLQAPEAAVFIDYGMWDFRDLAWDVTGRWGIYTINTKLTVDDLFVGGNSYGNTESIILVEGGSIDANRSNIDVEGGGFPTRAMVELVGRGDAANATGVTASFANLGFGRLPESTPLWLCRTGPDKLPCVLRVDRPGTSGGGTAGAVLVDVDMADCWSLNVDRATLGKPDRFPIKLGGKPDGDTSPDSDTAPTP
jgi:hypothetical protein